MRKQINVYFGNAYVRDFFFSLWENMTCNTDEITLFFVIYDL